MLPTDPDTLPATRSEGAGVSLYDARPFFEKALQHGIRHGLIDAAKLDAIALDAPKGMVQIARYFGNEFLRPDLEKARERLVNLVSLYLEHSTSGDLAEAAQSLQAHSFLSRSKGGSDMLKALLAMPQNSHFGMTDDAGLPSRFNDDQIPLLAKWALRPLTDYTQELAKRQQVAQVLDAAIWAAEQGGMDATDLQDAGKDAEAVIRTFLLVQATGRQRLPDWVGFEKTILMLRKSAAKSPLTLPIPKGLPESLESAVADVRLSVLADLPRILDTAVPVRQLFDRSPAFIGRYFWVEDVLHDVAEFDAQTSKAWDKATGGQTDESALLTLFLCIAAGSAPKTMLTEKTATTLIRKIRKTGLHSSLTRDYILAHAPVQFESDYAQLWSSFLDEAQSLLTSDAAFAMEDALALLRRECQVK
ncbi:MAG: hypothetical protein ACKVOT_10070 [Polaromonas sp.]